MPTPPKSLDDMPLAAYGGTGMEEEPATEAEIAAPTPAIAAPGATDASAAATAAAVPEAPGIDALPAPEDEPSHGASPLARLSLPRLPLSRILISRIPASRIIETFRTSRVAAAAGFAAVIVVGLLLLSGGAPSPAATAATPTNGPAAAATILPSGDVSMSLSGAATGAFNLSGLAGGQHVAAGAVMLAWGDTQQTTLSITGPIDRGTRTTDETLVLTLGVVVNGVPETFTSKAGECTIGMAEVGGKVQGSFTCHKLKGSNAKLTVEASGTYRS